MRKLNRKCRNACKRRFTTADPRQLSLLFGTSEDSVDANVMDTGASNVRTATNEGASTPPSQAARASTHRGEKRFAKWLQRNVPQFLSKRYAHRMTRRSAGMK